MTGSKAADEGVRREGRHWAMEFLYGSAKGKEGVSEREGACEGARKKEESRCFKPTLKRDSSVKVSAGWTVSLGGRLPARRRWKKGTGRRAFSSGSSSRTLAPKENAKHQQQYPWPHPFPAPPPSAAQSQAGDGGRSNLRRGGTGEVSLLCCK